MLPLFLKPSYRTDPYGKNSIPLGAINSWNKTQHQFSIYFKVYFLKNALEIINEKVKGVFLIKQTDLL